MWPSGDREIISKATVKTQKYVVDAIQEISKELQTGEIYLLGFSQGAIISYLVGISHFEWFSGLICLSGPGLLEPLLNPFGEEIDSEGDQEKQADKNSVTNFHRFSARA